MKWRKLQFMVASLVFLAWVGWLAWQTRDVHEPIVSRSQFAASDLVVRAKLTADEEGILTRKVRIEEILIDDQQDRFRKGQVAEIVNVPESRGFNGEGSYLLILSKTEDGRFQVTEPPPSPGYGRGHRPWVYRWSDGIRRQIEALNRD